MDQVPETLDVSEGKGNWRGMQCSDVDDYPL
jgi:hypothetical protein